MAKILVVDDDPTTLEVLDKVLSDGDHEVETTGDARYALKAIAQEAYDLCITDIQMPDMDGIDLVRRIRETRPDILTLVITAGGGVDSAVSSLDSGASDYMVKPLDPEELKEHVSSLLEHSRMAVAARKRYASAARSLEGAEATEVQPLAGDVGPYRIEELVRPGKVNEIYHAWDTENDRAVALKRVVEIAVEPSHLYRHAHGKDHPRERLRREAWLVSDLDHPSLVKVYDLFESDDEELLVMERPDGRLLSEILDELEDPMPIDRALDLAIDVADALVVLHAAKIVHRDINGGSIVVTPEGRARICDYSTAKSAGETESMVDETKITFAGMIVGTYESMSPEQSQGGEVDHRSDLFSLGTLLYHMLTGVLPFRSNTTVKTMMMICMQRQVPPRKLVPEIPEELEELVEELLAKKPERRPELTARVASLLRGIRMSF